MLINELLNKNENPIDTFDEFIFKQIQKKLPLSQSQIIDEFIKLLPMINVDKKFAKTYYNVFKHNFREDGNYSEITWQEFKGSENWESRKIPNSKASEFVNNLRPFKGSNLSAEWVTKNGKHYYEVNSYGYYPIYIYYDNKWYGNLNRYSVTTAKHMSNTRPHDEITWLSQNEMKNFAYYQSFNEIISNRRQKILSDKNNYIGRKITFKNFNLGIRIIFKITDISEVENGLVMKIDVEDVFISDRNFKPKSNENYLLGEIPNVNREVVEDLIINYISNDDYYRYLELSSDNELIKTYDFEFNHLKVS
jgi:hypothetical protein